MDPLGILVDGAASAGWDLDGIFKPEGLTDRSLSLQTGHP